MLEILQVKLKDEATGDVACQSEEVGQAMRNDLKAGCSDKVSGWSKLVCPLFGIREFTHTFWPQWAGISLSEALRVRPRLRAATAAEGPRGFCGGALREWRWGSMGGVEH